MAKTYQCVKCGNEQTGCRHGCEECGDEFSLVEVPSEDDESVLDEEDEWTKEMDENLLDDEDDGKPHYRRRRRRQ